MDVAAVSLRPTYGFGMEEIHPTGFGEYFGDGGGVVDRDMNTDMFKMRQWNWMDVLLVSASPFSVTPGFSRVLDAARKVNRFNGLPG